MSIRLRWLGYVCFEIVLPSGKVLVIDPFIDYSTTAPIKCQGVTGADYIAVTHGHYDHVTDIGLLADKFASQIICSHQVAGPLAKLFGLNPDNITEVTAGDNVTLDDLLIEVRRGEHIDLAPVRRALSRQQNRNRANSAASAPAGQEAAAAVISDFPARLRKMREDIRAVGLTGGEQLTFVFQTSDNLRLCVYSSGPYPYLREAVESLRPNVFCMQLGGNHPEKAAEIAALASAELVIPTHHDGGGIEATHSLAQQMAAHLADKSPAKFLDIVHGQWYQIGVSLSPL